MAAEEGTTDADRDTDAVPGETPAGPPGGPAGASKPTGRRDLSASKLPRMVVTVDDPLSAARGRLIAYEESYQLMRVRAETKVVVLPIAKYELTVQPTRREDGEDRMAGAEG